jgi:hypothetical protein
MSAFHPIITLKSPQRGPNTSRPNVDLDNTPGSSRREVDTRPDPIRTQPVSLPDFNLDPDSDLDLESDPESDPEFTVGPR